VISLPGFDAMDALVSAWRARAEGLRPYAPAAAAAFECAAEDLEQQVAGAAMEALSLTQAAVESGYSADHLGRLVAKGQIPNAGRPNAPRILRRDLPRKAANLPPPAPPVTLVGATPRQIARAVVNSKSGEPR
jgi:hypothetical protein